MLALGHFLICILLFISQNLPVSRFAEGASHNCARPCSGEPFSEKLCFHEFFVSEISIVRRAFNETRKENCETTCTREVSKEILLGINNMSPGPSIEACLGDTIEVLVHNKLKVHELSIHWHGIRQKDSAYMDGVPMVTQCPILPYGGFRYKFRPETAGTYFYHAHLVSQQGDGVYGSLTVRGPQDDPSLERILLLSSRSPTPLTRHSHFYPPTPSELVVNGQRDGAAVLVNHGTQYLLRLVNADAYNCPILLSTSGHAFRVVATDGNLVQSMTAAYAVLFPEKFGMKEPGDGQSEEKAANAEEDEKLKPS